MLLLQELRGSALYAAIAEVARVVDELELTRDEEAVVAATMLVASIEKRRGDLEDALGVVREMWAAQIGRPG